MLENSITIKDKLIAWIRQYFSENGPACSAVLGISGGKDSTIAAALCAEALGPDRVFGVLMPNGHQSDLDDAIRAVHFLGIPYIMVNIAAANQALLSEIQAAFTLRRECTADLSTPEGISSQSQVNLPPRLRMATLYAVAQSLPNGGRVVNTCNLSEDYVGFLTKHGDGAADFAPLANLTVEEVIQIGEVLNLPYDLVHKTPSDGLCGKSDEDSLGFTYAALDAYISRGELPDKEIKDKIDRLNRLNLHKQRPMPMFSDDNLALHRHIPIDWREL